MLRILSLAMALLLAPLAAMAEQTTANPQVMILTSEGEITVELYQDKSPITVANFLAYVDTKHYNNTIFHRVIRDFMIQGGGMNANMTEKMVMDPIVNESKNRVHNTRGTLAMARTNDPDSATAQFFINHRNNFKLDWTPGKAGYTVFGEVIDGMYVVDHIASVKTGNKYGHSDVPLQPITILEVVRVETP